MSECSTGPPSCVPLGEEGKNVVINVDWGKADQVTSSGRDHTKADVPLTMNTSKGSLSSAQSFHTTLSSPPAVKMVPRLPAAPRSPVSKTVLRSSKTNGKSPTLISKRRISGCRSAHDRISTTEGNQFSLPRPSSEVKQSSSERGSPTVRQTSSERAESGVKQSRSARVQTRDPIRQLGEMNRSRRASDRIREARSSPEKIVSFAETPV